MFGMWILYGEYIIVIYLFMKGKDVICLGVNMLWLLWVVIKFIMKMGLNCLFVCG